MSKTDKAFEKPYSPKDTEEEVYALWEQSGFFQPETGPPWTRDPKTNPNHDKTYSIVLPPPNVTGTLHMGHAAMLAVEDILIRYHRMRGFKTLWLPGTDSAAIATQAKVEDIIYKKEKKTRHDIGREKLVRRIVEFSEESKTTILHQLRRMGASLDWKRYAYTLDEKRYRAVMAAFKNMYDAGLIYRGARIVNWDPKMQTTVSDDEVERVEQEGTFYYLTYGPFVIGTARPETKFGDKYVVMHPNDKRYGQYKHGQKIELEWISGPITATVIKDEAVDMEFGTGVMTITPWHDATDFEIAERHGLDKEQIIDSDGKLLPIAGEFAGMHIKKARPLIVEKLKGKGLLERVDEQHAQNIATNSRGGGLIEPQIKKQWFVDVDKEFTLPHSQLEGIAAGSKTTLKNIMRTVVESGQIKILPKRFEKIYFHWIDNLKPWCISRQIWYGHRIPVWYRFNGKSKNERGKDKEETGQEIYCGVEAPQGDGWQQDPDTLDTWFSSGLWTFSTLGWPFDYAQDKPKSGSDLANFHPTSVLETGYDILFFWVARMILMSGFHLGTIPFHTVYLHGLVRDEQGRKMSKSLGNVIDPLDMAHKYGADATRMSLIVGAPPGGDIKLSEDKIRGYKHYANKIWNIARFILMNTEDADLSKQPSLTDEDKKLLEEFETVAKSISDNIEHYRLYLAAEELYHFIWGRLADVIIEESKPILSGSGAPKKASRQWTLYQLLLGVLTLLHPFMPFVTEAIWQRLSHKETELLMVAKWPAQTKR